LVAWSRSAAGAADSAWRALAELPRTWSVPEFPLKAADFMGRGFAAGPGLGAVLRAAERAWIAADFPADPVVIQAIADRAAQEGSKTG